MKRYIIVDLGNYFYLTGHKPDSSTFSIFIWEAKLLEEKTAERLVKQIKRPQVVARPVSVVKMLLLRLVGSPLLKPLG